MQTPLLLLHGALGSKAQMAAIEKHLPADIPVYALNFPGHGGLSTHISFSMPLFAKAVLEFLDIEHIPQADMFGYSMGGYAALYLAWKHPERVRRITTLGTKFDWTPETAARESAMLDPEKIEAKVPQFAQALAQRHAPADWKAVLRQTADLLHGLGNSQGLPPEAFANIRCPVMILLGEFDNMVTLAESQQAAAALPQGRFEILPGAKHAIEQVDQALLAMRLNAYFYPEK